MAFQPIVNVADLSVYAYEALVRGEQGEPAPTVLARIDEGNKYRFDQTCRVRAIELAAQLKLASRLHINFLPNAVYVPENCIQLTLEIARELNFPLSQLTFEVVEGELIRDIDHVKTILAHYRSLGFLTAMDDFGEGYSGLNLLCEIQPDIVKLDMKLIRGIDHDRVRQAIVRGIASTCEELAITIIAEGIETFEESRQLAYQGVILQQGYYFAKPAFEKLPEPCFDEARY